MSDLISYAQIIAQLQALIEEGASGTLFITTDQQHAARIDLLEGRISYIRYKGRQGDKAIKELAKMNAGSLRFDAAGLPLEDHSLPETAVILAQLGSSATEVPEPAAPEPKSLLIDLEAMEHLLAEYIGPIARLVIEDYLEAEGRPRNLAQLKKMISALAIEIDDTTQREAFIKKAHQLSD